MPATTPGAPPLSEGARSLLGLVRYEGPMTRAEIGDVTGWARVTVNARADELQAAGLLREAGVLTGTGGRPAMRFELDPSPGLVMVADVGATHATAALCDLAGEVRATSTIDIVIEEGPEVVVGALTEAFSDLCAREGGDPVWGIGVGLPGPIEHPSGRVVSPPIMTGWNGFSLADWMGEAVACPIVVENDAGAMAWGEWRHTLARRGGQIGSRDGNVIFVKVGTGVGVGIVANGALIRGADGAAGDLGHTFTSGPSGVEPPVCRCGNRGCVEAYVSGWAIIRDLAEEGIHVSTVRGVLDLLEQGDPTARCLVRSSGRVLGEALASAVSILNPAEVIIGGQFAQAGEQLLAGVREKVVARSLPLATGGLTIRTSQLGALAGVKGLADAVLQKVLG